MKTIGIEIDSNEAIIVVLEEDNGNIAQLVKECIKLDIGDSKNSEHIKQFRDQVNTTFDAVSPDKIGILSRNMGRGQFAPSPLSFKLEGIIQLYGKVEVQLISPKTVTTFVKKSDEIKVAPKYNYQADAFNLAYYLLK